MAALITDHAQQMHTVCMTGFQRKNFAITTFGFLQISRLMMLQGSSEKTGDVGFVLTWCGTHW